MGDEGTVDGTEVGKELGEADGIKVGGEEGTNSKDVHQC